VRDVIYLLALIGLVTLGVLFWRAFGPDVTKQPARRTLGPDDDPDFLRRIDPGAARGQSGESDDTGPSTL
jgi:hypothetical protein